MDRRGAPDRVAVGIVGEPAGSGIVDDAVVEIVRGKSPSLGVEFSGLERRPHLLEDIQLESDLVDIVDEVEDVVVVVVGVELGVEEELIEAPASLQRVVTQTPETVSRPPLP